MQNTNSHSEFFVFVNIFLKSLLTKDYGLKQKSCSHLVLISIIADEGLLMVCFRFELRDLFGNHLEFLEVFTCTYRYHGFCSKLIIRPTKSTSIGEFDGVITNVYCVESISFFTKIPSSFLVYKNVYIFRYFPQLLLNNLFSYVCNVYPHERLSLPIFYFLSLSNCGIKHETLSPEEFFIS